LPAARLRVPCAAPDLSYLDARFGESR
jgi:hypothetical protein